MKTNSFEIKFICGTTVDRAGISIDASTVESGTRLAGKLLLDAFGGYSKSFVEGAWRSPVTGQVAQDVSIVYSCVSGTPPNELLFDRIQAELKAAFHQESVPYVVTEVFCKF